MKQLIISVIGMFIFLVSLEIFDARHQIGYGEYDTKENEEIAYMLVTSTCIMIGLVLVSIIVLAFRYNT